MTGARLDFPRVSIIATGEGYEWSWEAVQRVVDQKNGAFFS